MIETLWHIYLFGTIFISTMGTMYVFDPYSDITMSVKDWVRFCVAWPVIIVMWLLSKD
jgi:hypothetical protein